MRARLDMDKIAKALGGERRGSVTAKGGYFGALNLAADVSARFKVPPNGGRRTDPSGRSGGSYRSARRRSSDWKRSPPRSGNREATSIPCNSPPCCSRTPRKIFRTKTCWASSTTADRRPADWAATARSSVAVPFTAGRNGLDHPGR